MIREEEKGAGASDSAGAASDGEVAGSDLRGDPRFDPKKWTFRCFGLSSKRSSGPGEFLKLPRVEVASDVHCVTHWSLLDSRWEGSTSASS